MNLTVCPYTDQAAGWPAAGRHIQAHFDAETVVVYQAYRPAIARHALAHGRFGGEFSFQRMSWIKPNFLWMMYRSGWGTKEGQQMTLGLRLRRPFFDGLLAAAVASSYDGAGFASHEAWKAAIADSDVRLQWDPDHDPHGRPLARRAIQLGLRGAVLAAFGTVELVEVIDMTPFVDAQRRALASGGDASLSLPVERTYTPADRAISARLGLDP
jgi:hypothetical protein